MKGLPSNQATKQPSNQATKQPSNQATKQPSNQAYKMQVSRAHETAKQLLTRVPTYTQALKSPMQGTVKHDTPSNINMY